MNRELHKPDDEAISLEGIPTTTLPPANQTKASAYLNHGSGDLPALCMRADIERVPGQLSKPDYVPP